MPADQHAVAALVLLRPGPGRAAQAGPPHRAGALDHLPGAQRIYLRWQELEAGVAARWSTGRKRVAMEYVPRNANPYVSRVDAGTIELVRSIGVEIVPSGDLIQLFEACWDDEQWAMHLEAAKHTRSAYDAAFAFIAERVREATARCARPKCSSASSTTSSSTTWSRDHPPIVGVGPHSGDPHYEPRPGADGAIRAGRFRADRSVGQARQAARRLQRSDLDRLRRQGSAGEVRGDLPDRGRRRATPPSTACSRPSPRESRCRAGRWTRRPAT